MRILVLEPYYGGSHKTFLKGLQQHIGHDFILMTLPASKWKWRMRLAAPYFAEKISASAREKEIDAILCSSFVDVATLRSLMPSSMHGVQVYTYFHENQFAYPVQQEDERDVHFGLTNLTTVLASDKVAFNTGHNMQTFLAGVEKILAICPDMKFAGMEDAIRAKSTILNPGVDFSRIDAMARLRKAPSKMPVIVWNHRWEHDKNPTLFFNTLFALAAAKVEFRLIILGQSFREKPPVFSEALTKLQHQIVHCGFVKSREEYVRLLGMGDIVVSTADHEFYGISVIEAVRAGCMPLLPNRLSYPELFPAEYLYEDGELPGRLKSLLQRDFRFDVTRAKSLTERFSWLALKEKYREWLEETAHAA